MELRVQRLQGRPKAPRGANPVALASPAPRFGRTFVDLPTLKRAEASQASTPIVVRGSPIVANERPPFPTRDVRSLAREVLGRELTQAEGAAVQRAHLVGLGELGQDGVNPASVGNFRLMEHVGQKARILLDAGFSRAEMRELIRAGVTGGSQVDAAHYAIATDLFNGRVVEAHDFSANGNQTPLWKVKVYNDQTGRTREALFKPTRDYHEHDGWGRTPMEYVTYGVTRMMGMDHVPPVALRQNLQVGDRHFGEGALLYFVPDAHLLRDVAPEHWGLDREMFLSDTRVVDVPFQNPDRNKQNFLRGKHWVDGEYRPMLSDNSSMLRPGTFTTLEQSDAFGSGPVHRVLRRTYDGLYHLHYDHAREHFGPFMSHDELNQIFERRSGILGYFDDRMSRYGRENVLVD